MKTQCCGHGTTPCADCPVTFQCWQCPACKAVMSALFPVCIYCVPKGVLTP